MSTPTASTPAFESYSQYTPSCELLPVEPRRRAIIRHEGSSGMRMTGEQGMEFTLHVLAEVEWLCPRRYASERWGPDSAIPNTSKESYYGGRLDEYCRKLHRASKAERRDSKFRIGRYEYRLRPAGRTLL